MQDDDYFPESELQMAYRQSQMEIQLRDPKIDEAINNGKFVVIYHSTAYCPRTDAILGERQTLDTIKDTLAQARECKRERDHHNELYDLEGYFTIEPLPKPVEQYRPLPPPNDEIPF